MRESERPFALGGIAAANPIHGDTEEGKRRRSFCNCTYGSQLKARPPMSDLRRYEISLPLRFNDGQPVQRATEIKVPPDQYLDDHLGTAAK